MGGILQFHRFWLVVAAHGEGGNADAEAFDAAHCYPAGFGGGTCGYDVVDKQDVLVLQCFAVLDGEYALHIVESLQACLVGLRVGAANADKVVVDNRARESLGYTLTDAQALVVAPSPFFSAVQRHGYKQVDAVVEPALGKMQPELAAHNDAKFLIAVVFYLVQYPLCVGFTPVYQQGGAVLGGHTSYEALLYEVVVFQRCCRFGQLQQAVGAEFVFVADKGRAADAAGAGKKELEEVA